eukprot:CAMPEP_0176462454 /NCGR_PEP_ID=MMETSP0127-20121128/35278_1 /TAXON_ID=938130 /ORGANISM="Platyophrya macrostoma, Strain WH" /LENGTH=162 /DNA_ID=CAMNT_0017854377 /DNA_START=652 /DNA_END=1140 /DNA_ORIENTATION=+
MASIALNGIFFAMGCLMLRSYVKRFLSQHCREEGLALIRLAYVGIFIAALRIFQNLLEVWQIPERVKRNSTFYGTLWWAVYGAIYLGLVNFLPTIFFMNKYAPNPSQKINGSTNASDVEGLLVHVIQASHLENNSKSDSASGEKSYMNETNDALYYVIQNQK